MVIGLLAEHFNPLAHGYLRFLINGIIVVAVFFVLMLCFGMNDYEKSLLFGTLKNDFRKAEACLDLLCRITAENVSDCIIYEN